MCTWDGIWNQCKARDHIPAWLRTLTGEPALLLAAVLKEHPRCAQHLVGLLRQSDTDPRIREAITNTDPRQQA